MQGCLLFLFFFYDKPHIKARSISLVVYPQYINVTDRFGTHRRKHA